MRSCEVRSAADALAQGETTLSATPTTTRAASPRRWFAVATLLLLAVLSVAIAPRTEAEVLPPLLPTLPAPPAEGNLLADVLGPASATACKTVATVYGLAGPIATAQLPAELRPLVAELDPYLALITYACGYLVVPPSGVVCSTDQALNEPLGLLGLPVALPEATAILYDTAAGIEHALARLGFDIGTDGSRQLAAALGCGVMAPPPEPDPAALPLPPEVPTVDVAAPVLSGGGLASIPAVVPAVPATPGSDVVLPGTAGQLGALRYPVRGTAALLLGLPLVLLAAAIAVGPRFARPPRVRRGPAPWSGS